MRLYEFIAKYFWIKNMIHLIHSYIILNQELLLRKKSTWLHTSSKFSFNGFLPICYLYFPPFIQVISAVLKYLWGSLVLFYHKLRKPRSPHIIKSLPTALHYDVLVCPEKITFDVLIEHPKAPRLKQFYWDLT